MMTRGLARKRAANENERPNGEEDIEVLNETWTKRRKREEFAWIFELPADADKTHKKVWSKGHKDVVLSKVGGISLTGQDFSTIRPKNWLNDSVIDAYFKLIVKRSQQEVAVQSVHAFSTFFYPKLVAGGYAGVERWTNGVNIFEFDLLLFPIHNEEHWSLVAFNLRTSTYLYYDSLQFETDNAAKKTSRKFIVPILGYMKQESLQKRHTEWVRHSKRLTTMNSPVQRNEFDCGVFTCAVAEHLSRDCRDFRFKQREIAALRRRIAYELATDRLLPSPPA